MSAKTLGILGGGQLGMMSAQAAKKCGITTIILTPEGGSPAETVADETIIADYDDQDALKQFASKTDVISYEFENIPVTTVQFLKALKPVYPDDNLLDIAQDRIKEKTFLNDIGVPTTNWHKITDPSQITACLNSNDTGIILKTTRFGYDGKGQVRIDSADQAENAWKILNTPVAIAEDVIDFDCEISVIVARDANNTAVHYGPMVNTHKNHILDETRYPAPLDNTILDEAIEMAHKLAEKVNLRGVLCLELFVTKDKTILANEIAPRTHNSGHWTIDACAASQFENHVRAVCGLSVIDPTPKAARMINLIGDDILKIDQYTNQKNTCVHTYGKQDIKDGRKMGHVTFLKE